MYPSGLVSQYCPSTALLLAFHIQIETIPNLSSSPKILTDPIQHHSWWQSPAQQDVQQRKCSKISQKKQIAQGPPCDGNQADTHKKCVSA